MKLLKMNLSALSFMLISSIVCFNSAFAADGKDALFNELGGKAGLTKIVDDFMPLVMADTRINRFFEKTDQVKLKAMLVDQFCELTGGPCKYTGRDMYEAHDGMGVRNAHFNALAEDLQMAMEKNNVPSSVANQLVAKLAPMQRPITSH
jgi:hemoglobin